MLGIYVLYFCVPVIPIDPRLNFGMNPKILAWHVHMLSCITTYHVALVPCELAEANGVKKAVVACTGPI